MRVLIAEDETVMPKAIKLLLEKAGCSVDVVHNGIVAWDCAKTRVYDVIVLDIIMPGMTGLDVLARIRDNRIRTPVLKLSARAEAEDLALGLESGADDDLPKPFASKKLIARVKELGSRSENASGLVKELGNLMLDGNRYEMRVGDRKAPLTNKEYRLMGLFLSHPGHVFSTEQLIEKIWGSETNTELDPVWTCTGWVRKKLRDLGADAEFRTVRGAGYALETVECPEMQPAHRSAAKQFIEMFLLSFRV